MFSQMTIIGRLGSEPELRYTKEGTEIVSFRVAVNTKEQGQDTTTWYSVSVFGKQGENCKQYLSKGSMIFVQGSLRANLYTDRAGQPKVGLNLTGNTVRFLGGGEQRNRTESERQADKPAQSRGDNKPWEYDGPTYSDDEAPF